tara:strand:+ start:282 stop:395 length:114 start_codon:yes stop_codon:yes gene_type:complete
MIDKKDELKVKFLPLANSYLMAASVPLARRSFKSHAT